MSYLFYIAFILIATGTTSSIMIIAYQYKLFAYWDYYKPTILGETCFFCIGFWLCFVQAVFVSFFRFDLMLLPCCLAAAAYVRFITKL